MISHNIPHAELLRQCNAQLERTSPERQLSSEEVTRLLHGPVTDDCPLCKEWKQQLQGAMHKYLKPKRRSSKGKKVSVGRHIRRVEWCTLIPIHVFHALFPTASPVQRKKSPGVKYEVIFKSVEELVPVFGKNWDLYCHQEKICFVVFPICFKLIVEETTSHQSHLQWTYDNDPVIPESVDTTTTSELKCTFGRTEITQWRQGWMQQLRAQQISRIKAKKSCKHKVINKL